MQINNKYYFIFLILKLIRTSDCSSSEDESLSFVDLANLLFPDYNPGIKQNFEFTLSNFEFEVTRNDVNDRGFIESHRNLTLNEMMSKVEELKVKFQRQENKMIKLTQFIEFMENFKAAAKVVADAYLTTLQSVSAKQSMTVPELLDRKNEEQLEYSETGNAAKHRRNTGQGSRDSSKSGKDELIGSQSKAISNINREMCKLKQVVAQIKENNEQVLHLTSQNAILETKLEEAENSHKKILRSHGVAQPQIYECADKIKQIFDSMDVKNSSADDNVPSDAVRMTLPPSPRVAQPRLGHQSFGNGQEYESIPVESMSSPNSPSAAGHPEYHSSFVDPSISSKIRSRRRNKQDEKNTLMFNRIVDLCNKLSEHFCMSVMPDGNVREPTLVELKSAYKKVKSDKYCESDENVARVALYRYEQTIKDLEAIEMLVKESLMSGACIPQKVESIMGMLTSLWSKVDSGMKYADNIRQKIMDDNIDVPVELSPFQEPESLQNSSVLDQADAKSKTKRNVAGPRDVKHGASLTADQVSKSSAYAPAQFELTQDGRTLSDKIGIFLKKSNKKFAASVKASPLVERTRATPNEAVSSSRKGENTGKLQQPSTASDKGERPLQHARVLSAEEAFGIVTTMLKQPFKASSQFDSHSEHESSSSTPTESSCDNDDVVVPKKKVSPTYMAHLILSGMNGDQ